MQKQRTSNLIRTVATVQGIYFVLTGLWPLVDIWSFMAVTGPKTDLWLVRTVGVLVLCIGLSITFAAWNAQIGRETVLLALLSTFGLTAIDLVYVAAGVIHGIYLLDAIAEVLLILGWVVCLRWDRHGSTGSTVILK
jgi:hypothetical protein